MVTCKVCGNSAGNVAHTLREMMLGTRHTFAYTECAGCGCMQIDEVPANLGDYYPKGYYSFDRRADDRPSGLKRLLKHERARYGIYGMGYGRNVVGWWLARRQGSWPYFQWLRIVRGGFDTRILDIGCGSGDLLIRMWSDGFTRVAGVDPFVEKTAEIAPGVVVHKSSLEDFGGTFDFAISHHSFEHVPDPRGFLHAARRRLEKGGHLMIATPLMGKFAWRTYGVNWSQLDAPRHVIVHTDRSIALLAKEAGFEVAEVVYDSYAIQFAGSEGYLKDVPLHSKEADALFTPDQIKEFDRRSAELNSKQDGDQACFFLRAI